MAKETNLGTKETYYKGKRDLLMRTFQIVHPLTPLVNQQRGRFRISGFHPVGEQPALVRLVPDILESQRPSTFTILRISGVHPVGEQSNFEHFDLLVQVGVTHTNLLANLY